MKYQKALGDPATKSGSESPHNLESTLLNFCCLIFLLETPFREFTSFEMETFGG